jgi:hypothetical protein
MLKQLYNTDFNKWIEQTIIQLQKHDFESLDIENLVEELIDLGKSEKRTLESNLMILLAHLLKLRIQKDVSEMMKASWYNSINEHRKRVEKNLKDTPSLKSYVDTAIQEAYPDARDLAILEGKNAKWGVQMPRESEYPLNCPFSLGQILNPNFYGDFD